MGRTPDVSRFRFYQPQMALFLGSLDEARGGTAQVREDRDLSGPGHKS